MSSYKISTELELQEALFEYDYKNKEKESEFNVTKYALIRTKYDSLLQECIQKNSALESMKEGTDDLKHQLTNKITELNDIKTEYQQLKKYASRKTRLCFDLEFEKDEALQLGDEMKSSIKILKAQKFRLDRRMSQITEENLDNNVQRGGWCLICYETKLCGKCCSNCRRFFCDRCIIICPDMCAHCRAENSVTEIVRFD